jgi:hypothetical protein
LNTGELPDVRQTRFTYKDVGRGGTAGEPLRIPCAELRPPHDLPIAQGEIQIAY